MLVRESDFDGHAALRAADIGEGLVVLPGKLLRNPAAGPDAEARHGLQKPFKPLRIAIERAEEIAAGFHLILRLAGAEPVGERPPKAIQPRVAHFEDAADV